MFWICVTQFRRALAPGLYHNCAEPWSQFPRTSPRATDLPLNSSFSCVTRAARCGKGRLKLLERRGRLKAERLTSLLQDADEVGAILHGYMTRVAGPKARSEAAFPDADAVAAV